MTASKGGANARPAVNTLADAPVSPSAKNDVSSTLATDPHPTVRVNKSHLAEIKTALDDIVKEVSPEVASAALACSH